MALHPDFPDSPHAVFEPDVRWFPADEALREKGYEGATNTSISLLNWWFNQEHLMARSDGSMAKFQYYFAQQEAVETIVFLYDVVKAKDKYDLIRFDSSGAVSANMFDESWRRFVIKMATGSGKTKVMSLILAWFRSIEDIHRLFLYYTINYNKKRY